MLLYRAKHIFEQRVQPMFRAAGLQVTAVDTEHRGHATEIARTLDLSSCSVLACVGGDGTLHELLQVGRCAPLKVSLAIGYCGHKPCSLQWSPFFEPGLQQHVLLRPMGLLMGCQDRCLTVYHWQECHAHHADGLLPAHPSQVNFSTAC